ncbi:MAG: carbohydrate kinase family protein [Bacteroidota bacterium]
MAKNIVVSGVGCCLVDRLYNVSFETETFKPYLSRENGDGGLTPGQLVFREEFEKFSGQNFQTIHKDLLSERDPDKMNIGGPGIVSMIHASQLSDLKKCDFQLYGCRGGDEDGEFIMSLLENTPLNAGNYKVYDDETPSTVVLSDPEYDHGHGERIFINSISAAWDYLPDELNEDFYNSDVVVFGGTALVPLIHDHMTEILKRAKSNGCITVVNTVYDFRNEKANPQSKWPLGSSDESYRYIDLLMMDLEEAIRLSGKPDLDEAMQFFQEKGAGAVIVTSGAQNIRIFSGGKLFKELEMTEMPVSQAVAEELKKGHDGDTTGCGDNFAGGVIASLVSQIQDDSSAPDIMDAAAWGIVSGGTSCFYMGGMYEERHTGDKKEMIMPYYKKYRKQAGLLT